MRAMERKACAAGLTGLVLATLLLSGAAGWAQNPPPSKMIVANVEVVGTRLVPPSVVKNTVRTRPGVEYNQGVVQDDIRRLLETKQFGPNTRAEYKTSSDGQVTVYFVVEELPNTIQEIVYNGAKHIKDKDLDEATGLRKNGPMNPIANQLARQSILRKYQEKGRLFASCELVEGDKPTDKRVVFNITEGPVVKVSSIEFQGQSFVSEARLRTQINSSRALLGILGGDFNPDMADADVVKLEEYYRTFGYQGVRVSRELQWEPDQRRVRLVFHIHEGQRYKVANVDVTGNKYFDREKLLTTVQLRPGGWYDENVIKADMDRIKDHYGYTGRDVEVRRNLFLPKAEEPNGEVKVSYEVVERPPARVGTVSVVGNDVTRQNVILRQVPLYPGQVLTYPDIRVAEANLARLNIFEVNPETGVRPTVLVLDNPYDSNFKDLQINVQETQTGSLLFGVGVNSDAGLTGSIVLNERNFDITRWPTSMDELLSGHAFRGAGQEFRVEAVPGTQLQRYTVSFREPFLFDSLYSLGTSAYYFTRSYVEYDESRLGGRVTIGRRLNPVWSAQAGVRVEEVGVNDVPLFAPFEISEFAGSNFQVGLRLGLTRDTRDSYLRPTGGSMLDLSFEQMFGDFTFPLFIAEGSKYWTIYQRADGSGRQVLAARSQVAIAGANTPVYERFYAGGFRSLRGFEFRGVGPNIRGFEVGGDFLFLNSLEYQIPILANDQLYFVAFVDSGTVEPSVEIKDYRVTAGAGLRIVVPMLGPVPIALDFGFPIVKKAGDREQIFSFYVGFFH